MYQEIVYEVNDPVATITLNRPERLNAKTPLMDSEIVDAVAAAEADEKVVGLVITGAGRGFCAGGDVLGAYRNALEHPGDSGAAHMTENGEAARAFASSGINLLTSTTHSPGDLELLKEFGGALSWLCAVRKPVIAAVNGPAVGWGMALALYCDVVYMAENAFFKTAYAQLGLLAEHGNEWILPRLFGAHRALELLWTDQRIDGREAERLGLINHAVPADRLIEEATGFVRRLAAISSPHSLRMMKKQVYGGLVQTSSPQGSDGERTFSVQRDESDVMEGRIAFKERRQARFSRLAITS